MISLASVVGNTCIIGDTEIVLHTKGIIDSCIRKQSELTLGIIMAVQTISKKAYIQLMKVIALSSLFFHSSFFLNVYIGSTIISIPCIVL